MQKIEFAQSAQSTIGVVWEIALVNQQSSDLCSIAQQVLDNGAQIRALLVHQRNFPFHANRGLCGLRELDLLH